MQNHGLLTLGDTVDEAMALFTNLDRLCGVQLAVEAAAANGLKKSIIDEEVCPAILLDGSDHRR